MRNALRAEYTKLVTLRGTYIHLAALLLIGIAPAVLLALTGGSGASANLGTLSAGRLIFSPVACLFVGAPPVIDYASHMAAHACITQPRRSLWLAAKGLVLGAAIALTWVTSLVLSGLILRLSPVPFQWTALDALLADSGAIAVYCCLAFSIGAGARNVIGAMMVPALFLPALERLTTRADAAANAPLLAMIWPGARLKQLAQYLTGTTPTPVGWDVTQVQPLWFNLLLLTAWVVLPLAWAFTANERRNID